MGESSCRPMCVSLLAAGLLVVGCGDDGGETTRVPRETAQPLPRLSKGWRAHVNRRGGFGIGLPRGWKGRRSGESSLLRSPDRLVAVSVSADRTEEALATPLERYARSTARALDDLRPGGEPPLYRGVRTGRARRFDARYEAVAIPAAGRAREGGLPQRLLLVVMRRDEFATYPILVAANARRPSPFRVQVPRMLRTLRGRPARAR